MLHVSLFVECLRSRPHLTVWAMALLQGLLWTLVPALFYSAPPGQLPETIAIGHEFRLATYLGPPLAYWLAEIAYHLGRFGIYLLAQACVVITYWSVFTLGTSIVGARHAAFAVVLMGGIYAFTVPTPEFGPGVLSMALWALALLHFWRASEQGRFAYWIALGIDLGLLLLTSYASLVFLGLLLTYLLLSERGRAQFTDIGPWSAGVIIAVMTFPQLIWLDHPRGAALAPAAMNLQANPVAGLQTLGWLVTAHAGLIFLIFLAVGLPAKKRAELPTVEREPVDPDGRYFVYFFALAPTTAMCVFAVFVGGTAPIPVAPLAVLSGLAVMVAAPDSLRLVYQKLAGFAWAALVVLPPLLAIGALTALPWAYKYDLAIGQPAGDMGRFFSESFQRRTGKPLAIVTGDEHTAALVALAAPSRPSVYFDTKPERSPWVSRQDIESKGAVVVWPTTDTTGAPPAEIKARFPELIPDVPRSFSRTVQGRLPLMRIGWGVIRPRGSSSEAPPQVQPPIQVQPQTQPRVQPQAQPLVQPQSQPLAQPKLEPPPQQKTPPRPQQQRRPQPQQRFRDPGTQW
jgi:outer membrane biosynthesis protein TonB